ncbi:hypothetical protein FIBSPDRAFT_849751 [Athelia psychrophila]|uniref:Uncharacterized protein n=1 Tax=Athelia psychrophila TaxID=1759441 RepID=A0A166U2Z1_9AGAM|nr:hypothetical protein FIBSPDRAFT_849751 [Fibularhizoctonia sp. CBS 109695]
MYQYALKTHSKIANVTARAWRDVRCDVSQLFATTASQRSSPHNILPPASNGVTVDRIWRDHRFTVWGDS